VTGAVRVTDAVWLVLVNALRVLVAALPSARPAPGTEAALPGPGGPGQLRRQLADQGRAGVPQAHAEDAAGDTDRDRLARHVADDAPARPAGPSACRTPASARAAAAIVSKMARPNAAAGTAADSHQPRLLAGLDALLSDPVASLARSLQ
jgi:hypothetical protein